MEKEKTHFILVHGACHGAWCWYKLATLLESEGYRVTTPDLAASGIDPRQTEDIKSISEYSTPLMELLVSLPSEEKVILVGHSLGGAVISLAMERFPNKIVVGVFLTAFMFGPDNSFASYWKLGFGRVSSEMDNKLFFSNGLENPPTSFIFGREFVAAWMYDLCPPEVLGLARTLLRPQFLLPGKIIAADVVVSREKYGSVRRVYIVSEDDKSIKQDIQRLMIEAHPPDEVIDIKGSDHMVMLSKPHELYACLKRIAAEPYSKNKFM